MKKAIFWALAGVGLSAVMAAPAVWADGGAECPMPMVKSSAGLERMKSLAGTWTGTAKHADGKEEPVIVQYQTTSGGAAVEERLVPGTPKEMVSIYHDEDGKLAMTHYCMLGNQPHLALTNAKSGQLALAATPQTRKSLKGQMYMSSVVMEQPAPDQLVQTWTGTDEKGKVKETTVFTLKKS